MGQYAHKGQILPLENQMIPIDKETTFHASYDYGLDGMNQGVAISPMGYTRYLDLDGSSGYVAAPEDIWFNGDFTIEAWVYVRSYNNWSRIMDFGNGPSSDNILLALSGTTGKVNVHIFNGSSNSNLTTADAIPTNVWVHVAATLKGTALTIYKNGVSWATSTVTYTPRSIARKNNYIGLSNWSADSKLNAGVSNFKIWSRALSQSEIKDGMYENISDSRESLVVNYKLNQSEGLVAFDLSKNANDGLLNGGSKWSKDVAQTVASKAEGKFRDGVLIEPDTVNIAKNTDYTNRTYGQVYDISGWGGDDADVIYYAGGGYNGLPYKKMIKHTGGTGGSYIDEHALFPIKDNTTYVISCYMKASRNVTVNGYALDINRPSDNAYRTGGDINLTTEWKRHSWVYNSVTGHAGDYHSRQIIYIDDVLPTEIYWSGFQVEEKPIATSYVNGSRPEGRLEYPAASLVRPSAGTISMWVKPRHSAMNSHCNIFSVLELGNENTNRLSVERSSNTSNNYYIVTGIGTIDYSVSTNFTITPDVWSHLIVTWDSSVFNVYVNGTNVLSWTTTKMPTTFSKSVLDIGCGMNWKNRNIDGVIDEVRIESRAISAEEASAWAASGLHYNYLDYSMIVD